MKRILLGAAAMLLAAAARAEPVAATIELVNVPGGCYPMGYETGEKHERPVHKECVQPFAIGKHEVTQAQWQAAMGTNPSRFSSCGADCPVEQVSWNDVQIFLRKLNDEKAGVFRLPTEAEWEYACRSGGRDEVYPGGVAAAELAKIAWYNKDEAGNTTHPVGKKAANGLGIHDMAGNVWEWVQDTFTTPYGAVAGTKEARIEDKRVVRGGSWDGKANYVRCGIRNRYEPDKRDFRIGVRVVKEIGK